MKKLDFPVYENPIKEEISKFFKIYKNTYNKEAIMLKQIKDNIEILDFLNFEEDTENLKNEKYQILKNIKRQCNSYNNLLVNKINKIKNILDNMSGSSKNSKDGRQLQKMIKIMERKSLLLKQCIDGDIISIIMLWKNISIIPAIIYYRRYFNFTPEIKTKLKKEIKCNLINYSGYISLISIALTIICGIISSLLSPTFSAIFTILAIIMGILFVVFGLTYIITLPD